MCIRDSVNITRFTVYSSLALNFLVRELPSLAGVENTIRGASKPMGLSVLQQESREDYRKESHRSIHQCQNHITDRIAIDTERRSR